MSLLGWAVIALVISLIAGGLGFSGVSQGAASVAKILFAIFLVLAILLFVFVMLGIGAIT